MLTQQQKIDLLTQRGINRSEFQTFALGRNLTVGQPIGIGTCTAVILRLNRYLLNTITSAENTLTQIYYGDRQRQQFELLRGESSQIIFAKDLSEIYVRSPFNEATFAGEHFVQALVYHNDRLEQYERNADY